MTVAARARMMLRRWKWLLLPSELPQMGSGCRIHPMAQFLGHPRNIRLGDNVTVDAFATLYCHKDGSIEIGDGTYVADHTQLHTGSRGGTIRLGRECSVQFGTIVYGHGGCLIGDDVRIAAHCTLIPTNHRFDDPALPIRQQGRTSKGIRIDSDVWIGAGCVVADGVSIGSGSIIGAGSVVTRSIPTRSVAVGIPARVTRTRPVPLPPDDQAGPRLPEGPA
jgi:acetyltransferase-like isoleucine patch superfamily enzyme